MTHTIGFAGSGTNRYRAITIFVMLAIPVAASANDNLYTTRIAPLLAERCGACHGQERQRGQLALHTPQAIREGGDSGAVLIAGKPAESELIRRLRLPADDNEHMPPAAKPQLTEDEISLIEQWVAAGASFGATTSAPAESSEPQPAAAIPQEPIAPAGPADPAALRALREHLVHVEAVREGSTGLRLEFAAVAAKTTDAEAARLLRPVLPQLEMVSLARCPVGDETARLLTDAPRLTHLDLRGSRITDAGVTALSRLPVLRELGLAQTHLTDASVQSLASMPGLQRLHIWKAGLSEDGIARLMRERPGLRVNAGTVQDAATREVEPAFQLTGDAPPPAPPRSPGAASQPAEAKAAESRPAVAVLAAAVPLGAQPPASQPAAGLQAVNSTCPVSGKPAKSEYSIIHRGRIIAFCCPDCASQFWKSPEKFNGKLLAADAR